MFLSDELIEIGLKANPKNNLSQAIAASNMLNLLHKAQSCGEPEARLINITKFAVKQLNKKGFNYYRIETFWGNDNEN